MLRYEAQIPRVETSAQHKQLTFSLHVQICRVAAKHQELLAAHVFPGNYNILTGELNL